MPVWGGQRREFCGQGEGDVEIGDGQQIGAAILQPGGARVHLGQWRLRQELYDTRT